MPPIYGLSTKELARHPGLFTRRGVVQLGAPAGIRTRDLRLRRPLLYPAELQAQEASSED